MTHIASFSVSPKFQSQQDVPVIGDNGGDRETQAVKDYNDDDKRDKKEKGVVRNQWTMERKDCKRKTPMWRVKPLGLDESNNEKN